MSARLEIDERSMRVLGNRLDDIKKDIPAAAYESMVAYLFSVKSLAQNRLKDRRHIITSRLRNSLHVMSNAKRQDSKTYSGNDGKTYSAELKSVSLKDKEAAVGTNVEYAASIELGSKPHVILPVVKKVLSWIDKITGERVFARRVNHPGTKGDSFLYWAFQNASDKEFVKEYNRQVNTMKRKYK